MSKLSFRARALDATKPMAVYKAEEIPNLLDFAAINRTVPQMPTGMEKEEESEHHLQRALSTQQVYGQAEVIPVPEIDSVNCQRYEKLYRAHDAFKPPKQYVHVQAFGVEQEIPDYDMDSEDETWLNKQAKKMEVTPIQFENMMDRLEKGSGQMVVTLQEAKALLKEDDDLIIAVYDYWLNKRLNKQQRLIPQVKTEKRDGSSSSDPYVAFRRRTEKMQTRKNRKNDETSYEKMLKLRRDLNKALTILELMKRREKSKKELLQLTIEIFDKRYQMQDWSGTSLQEALAKRHTLPSYIPIPPPDIKWGREPTAQVPRKRYQPRKPKKHKVPKTEPQRQLPQYSEVDIPHVDQYSSEEEGLSPVSPSDQEQDDDPDGIYAFRRKANCSYHAPLTEDFGNWPWCSPEEGGPGDKRFRFSLLSLSQPRRCVGFARRRVGRGGRVWIDRGYSDWDDQLTQLDYSTSPPPHKPYLSDLTKYIRDHKIPHFRPQTPTEEDSNGGSLSPTSVHSSDFNAESFQWHQEQLLAMQRHQQEEMMKQESSELDSSFDLDLDHSFSSQPTSRFTLDKATARFAASAVCNSTQELLTSNPVSLPKPPNNSSSNNSSNSHFSNSSGSHGNNPGSHGQSGSGTPGNSNNSTASGSNSGSAAAGSNPGISGSSSSNLSASGTPGQHSGIPGNPGNSSNNSSIPASCRSSQLLGHLSSHLSQHQSSTSSSSSSLAASLSSVRSFSSSSSLPTSLSSALSNGPSSDLKNSGLSTSPQASVLTLNYPLPLSNQLPNPLATPLSSTIEGSNYKRTPSIPVIGNNKVSTVSPVVTNPPSSGSTPALLKLPPSHDHASSIITAASDNNHDAVSRLKEQSVAMEVT